MRLEGGVSGGLFVGFWFWGFGGWVLGVPPFSFSFLWGGKRGVLGGGDSSFFKFLNSELLLLVKFFHSTDENSSLLSLFFPLQPIYAHPPTPNKSPPPTPRAV